MTVSKITAIAVKEFKSYLASPMAYIITCIFLLFTGVFFSSSPSTYSETSLSGFMQVASYLILLLSAALTMRLLAEERKLGTLELLLTAPIRDSEIIFGKFLGSLGIMVTMLALTLYYPLLFYIFGGDPDVGPIITSYLGLFLLGCSALSVGLFASSFTSNQILSAVVAGGILFGLWFLGIGANYLPDALGEIIGYFSLSYYYPDFIIGIIDTRGIIYYLSITVLFLFFAIRSLENSRWN